MNNLKVFLIFVFSISIFTDCQNAAEAQSSANSKSVNTNNQNKAEIKAEAPEQKAVRLAEEFIKRNGYTDAAADKKNLSFESLEFSNNTEDILEARKNTLEAKAFGISHHGLGDEKGWTVVFRYNKSIYEGSSENNYNTHGRAVTMNEDFKNLRVQHKDFFLDRVERKLQ